MQVSHHESDEQIFRKKFRGVNLLATSLGITLFQPNPGPKYILLNAFLYAANVVGTSTGDPSITLTTTGVGGGAVVAAVDVGADAAIAQGSIQALTVVPGFIIDNTHPLTITIPAAATGSTTLKLDVILVLLKIYD